jgi:hypothetical protein
LGKAKIAKKSQRKTCFLRQYLEPVLLWKVVQKR